MALTLDEVRTGRLVRQSVLNGSKKRIYDAEYGYDMNNNVSKFTSSAGGVSMTEKFDCGKDNLASKYKETLRLLDCIICYIL